MSCIPLPKAAKPVWANQLTRLSCLVVYVKLHSVTEHGYFCFSALSLTILYWNSPLLPIQAETRVSGRTQFPHIATRVKVYLGKRQSSRQDLNQPTHPPVNLDVLTAKAVSPADIYQPSQSRNKPLLWFNKKIYILIIKNKKYYSYSMATFKQKKHFLAWEESRQSRPGIYAKVFQSTPVERPIWFGNLL